MSANETDTRKLNLQPGINQNTTQLDAEGTYVSCDKVRFYYGKPEKIGGFVKETYTGSVTGIVRDAIAWTDLYADRCLAIGTHKKLQTYVGGTFYDITPIDSSASTVNGYSVVCGDSYIKLSITHAAAAGDYFILADTTTDVGGITLAAGNSVRCYASAASSLTFTAFGSELSA